MIRPSMLRLCAIAGAALIAAHVVHDTIGFGGAGTESFFGDWFLPVAFFGCGAATIARGLDAPQRRAPWILLGAGLLSYAGGSVYFNLAPVAAFPSMADAMWLALYPLAFAAMVLLVRSRFRSVGTAFWLDGAIGGSAVAAVAAATVFQGVFDTTVSQGAASAARLAYPLGDLVALGFVVVVWSIGGRRLDRFWLLIGAAFGLLALADSTYVVQAAHGGYQPGTVLDLPYALATMALAVAAWTAPGATRAPTAAQATTVTLPVSFGLSAVVLTAVATLFGLNPLATALSLLTLLLVVARLGITLASLTRQRAELAALAATDPLTGLANHRTLHERLAAEVERARRRDLPLSVVTLDLDHFKAINDTYGHSEGDLALQAIAAILRRECRARDLVGRVGGEEFALVLPEATGDAALAVAERCRAALARLTVHGSGVGCSAGVASYPADDPTGARLLELADGALYWAKRSGRAQTRRFDPREVVLLSSAEQRAQVRAVLARRDALTPVFQPIVELATGRIAGYEALTRFLHSEPVRSPDQWFAQARRCGLGGALEARAIEMALAVPGRPRGTYLTINLSPGALVSSEVAAVLPDDLSDIVIELTEDELFASDDALDVRLAALRARGARIAVDDAGAGYAGLQQLIRIKPEILKLDRSLINDLHTDPSKIALLDALSRFAITTGAAVCAEGIESIEELRLLARFDVTYAQGYALARPGPAWPDVAVEVAAEATSELTAGMRLARAPWVGEDAPVSLGDVTEALARARTREDLNAALALLERLVHADTVALSAVRMSDRCVETLSTHDWVSPGERFNFEEYPTTEHVIDSQTLGQLIEGDPEADASEMRFLTKVGFRAVLLAPVVFGGETVGLLETYRRTPRPWSGTEVDQIRVAAHQVGAVMQAGSSGWARVTAPGASGDTPHFTLPPERSVAR